MEVFTKISLFIAGTLLPLFLIPFVEKRKNDFHRSKKLQSFYIELDDLQSELTNHISCYFKFLRNIRTEHELVSEGKLPIPLSSDIDVTVLLELYKEVSQDLNQAQRLVIKKIPETLKSIISSAHGVKESFTNKNEYCVMSSKNTIKNACLLTFQINHIRQTRERYVERDFLNSNSATEPVLKGLGFSSEDIAISRILETNLDNIECIL